MATDRRRARGLLIAAALWLVVATVVALGAKFWLWPRIHHLQKTELVEKTSNASAYKLEIPVAHDAFSGYAFLRSAALAGQLKTEGYKLDLQDDKADYIGRVQAMRDGKIKIMPIPINSYLEAGAAIGEFPGTIVMIIDETKDADAVIAYKQAVPSFKELDTESAQFVLTPNSPSEYLGRVVIGNFAFVRLPEKWFIAADGAREVYNQFKRADKSLKRAYVMWEPYVSMALQDPDAIMLLGSSKLQGHIVDVLVVEREFLASQPDVVKAVVEDYLRASYSYQQDRNGLIQLIRNDSQEFGELTLTDDLAASVVNGIQWKTTTENYAHFGLTPGNNSGLEHIEDMITKITRVLVQTGALTSDPLNGQPNTIYYAGVLQKLQAEDFHPGKKVSSVDIGVGTADLAPARGVAELSALTDQQWEALIPVGTMRIPPISFSRASARMSAQSQRDLDELARTMTSFPTGYLKIVGRARALGDQQANLKLAEQRAQAARDYLLTRGVSKNRVKAIAGSPSGSEAGQQAVEFILSEKPY